VNATEETMKSHAFRILVPVLALAFVAAAVSPLFAEEPTIWLRVEVNKTGEDHAKIKVTLPLSLIEVAIESVDPSRVFHDIKSEKGIDLAKMWKQVRNLDVDEFITVDSDEAKVKVYKDSEFFRITVQEENYEKPNVEVRIPFTVMDYLFEEHKEGFKFSDLVRSLKGQLPLTLIEATHDEGTVKVWIEEK